MTLAFHTPDREKIISRGSRPRQVQIKSIGIPNGRVTGVFPGYAFSMSRVTLQGWWRPTPGRLPR
jgi:hypothetical protein